MTLRDQSIAGSDFRAGNEAVPGHSKNEYLDLNHSPRNGWLAAPCRDCGRWAPKGAKGLCSTCHAREWKRRNRARSRRHYHRWATASNYNQRRRIAYRRGRGLPPEGYRTGVVWRAVQAAIVAGEIQE